MTGLRVWSRGVRAAPAALLAHIVGRQEPVACPDIPAALEPALTLAVSIAIAFARTTRPIISTVVHVPVLPSPCGGFAHIVVRQEPVACPDIPAALEPALTLAVSIAIAFARTTRPIISTVVHVPVLPSRWRRRDAPPTIDGANPRDIVGLEPVQVGGATIHNGRHDLPMLVRVVEAEDMPEFVEGHSMEVEHVAPLWSRIGAPLDVGIKHHIAVHHFTRGDRPTDRHGEGAGTKGHAAAGGGSPANCVEAIISTQGGGHAGPPDEKLKLCAGRIPSRGGIFGSVVPTRTPVDERAIGRAPDTQIERDLRTRPEMSSAALGSAPLEAVAVRQTAYQEQQERKERDDTGLSHRGRPAAR